MEAFVKRSLKENFEEIKIQSFTETIDKAKALDIEIDTLTVMVPFNSSQFAISAMLKGYFEHFLSVTGDKEQFSQELIEKIDHNLKVLKESVPPEEKSSLILP